MSLQKMIADVETERSHNSVLGDTFVQRLAEIKARQADELDALADEFRAEIATRDAALSRIITGDNSNAD
jgi:hypothetical protein